MDYPIRQIRKRDGRIVPFDRTKIEHAVAKAARAVGNGVQAGWAAGIAARVTELLVARFGPDSTPEVEQIQDVVEEVLIGAGHPAIAKAYILYREQRSQVRATEHILLDGAALMDDYLKKLDWRVSENSNMNYSLQGLNFYVASSISARYWLHRIYPPQVRQAHTEGAMHIHDLSVLAAYTYYGKEVVIARLAGQLRVCSLEQLYEDTPGEEVLLNEADGAYAKYPTGLFVLDKDGWTRAVRLVRKTKQRPMRFIKNRGGRSVIVTDNHPMITQNGEKEAQELGSEDRTFTVDPARLLAEETLFSTKSIDLAAAIREHGPLDCAVYLDGRPLEETEVSQDPDQETGLLHTATSSIPRLLQLTGEFGYFVGFALAEGFLSYDAHRSQVIAITQREQAPLLRANRGLLDNGISGVLTRRSDARWELRVTNPFLRFLFERVFQIKPGSRHKTLPVGILSYNQDFVKGVIAGVLDGDGSLEGNGTQLLLRVAARTLLEQLAVVLELLGFVPRDRAIEGQGSRRAYRGREIVQDYPLYGLAFSKTDVELPAEKYQRAAVATPSWHDSERDAWHRLINNLPVEIPDDVIYDITTESGTLIVNGMWNHNCCGWDLQDLLMRGFGGVPAKVESRPPRHLRSALGQVVNFFYTLQGETAGAQAFSNFDTLLAPFIAYDELDYKGVKQAIQEFVYNINVPTRVGFQSLAWDELVVVRRNGRIEVVEIGQLVDEQFARNNHRVLRQAHDSYAIANADDIQTLAFDTEGRVGWAAVKAFVRHRVPDGTSFVRVRTSRGTARVSPAHSLFAFETLNERFNPRPIAACEVEVAHGNARLTPTNHFIAVRQAPNGGTRDTLDLVELIDAVPQVADRARVRVPDQSQAVQRLQQRVREQFGGLTPFYLEYGIKDKGCWQQWSKPKRGTIPYRVWRALGDNEPEAEFSLRNSDLWYSRTLTGERLREFIRLLAWYITEGHNDITNGLYVSQARGGDQEEMMRVLGALGALGHVEERQGWSAQRNPTSAVLRMAGKGLLAVLIGYLAGTYSTNKIIPWFVYDLVSALQETFIATLLRGDASEFPEYFDYTTTSKKLSLGLSLLLAMNDYKFSVYETSYDRQGWSDQYILRVYKDKEAAERYAVGDLLARVCLRREAFTYEREYEYDLSVAVGLENFAGGSGLLCFHNTPFTNITVDLTPSPTLRDQAVIIGGELQDRTYGEFQREMDLLNRAFAEVMLEGDAKGRVFSVDYASYSLVREDGVVRLGQIGEYIDQKMTLLSPEWIEDNQAEVLDVRDLDIETVGVLAGKVGWHKVNYLVRHPTDRLLRITTVGGFNVSVTPSHSILVVKNGDIVACQASDLKPGDYLLAPRRLDLGEHFVGRLSLAHEFGKRDPQGIYLYGVKDGKGCLYREVRTSRGHKPYNYKVTVIPLDHVIDTLDELDLSEAQVGLAGSDIRLPNTITIDEPLMEFLGYYVAEGSAEKGPIGGISLGFNLAKERELAHRIARWVEKAFGTNVVIREVPARNLVEVRVHSKLLRRVLVEVFGVENGSERELPDLVFNVPDDMKRAFIRGYFDGDAYRKGNALFASTISPGVACGVSTLLKQLGIAHTLTEYTRDGEHQIYRVNLWDAELLGRQHRTIGKLPMEASGLTTILESLQERTPQYRDALGRTYANSLNRVMTGYGIHGQETISLEKARRIIEDAERMGIQVPQGLKVLVDSDLIFLKVKSIEESKPTTGMVYDFSTDAETFLANQILVHNTFPIPTYNITADFDWENDDLQPLWEMTARYGIPYFANYTNSDMKPEDARSMCCRLRLDNRELRRRTGGLFAASPLTGSVGVVTLNMPRIGYLSASEDEFFARLGNLMDMAQVSLEIKRKTLERLTEQGLYPYSRHYLAGIKARNGAYWDNHFSTIGLNGMNEACLNFLGVGIEHPDGKAFALKVLDFMLEKLRTYQEETGHLYNLEASPAEGAAYRLARADVERYPHIITAGTREAPYYTNCLSSDTEVLTRAGWRTHDQLQIGDEVLTYNLVTKTLEYQRIRNVYVYGGEWEMVNIRSRAQDQLVTPNHMVLFESGARKGFEFLAPAAHLPRRNFMVRMGARWCIQEDNPAYSDDLLRLIAWIVTEGHFEVDNSAVRITQARKSRYWQEIKGLLDRAGIGYSILGTGEGKHKESIFRIGARDGKWIREIIQRKILPQELLASLSERQLNLLLLELAKGDGVVRQGRPVRLYTASAELAGQYQEIAIKTNKRSVIGYGEGTYYVDIVNSRCKSWITDPPARVGYEGIVWCIEVPNHTFVARRNGRPFITGNSTHLPVNYTDDLWATLAHQDELQTRYTGGTVLHIFLGERLDDWRQARLLVRRIAENFRLPYYTLTPTFSICPIHGYIPGEHQYCPYEHSKEQLAQLGLTIAYESQPAQVPTVVG